jgi:hypothetical protein
VAGARLGFLKACRVQGWEVLAGAGRAREKFFGGLAKGAAAGWHIGVPHCPEWSGGGGPSA